MLLLARGIAKTPAKAAARLFGLALVAAVVFDISPPVALTGDGFGFANPAQAAESDRKGKRRQVPNMQESTYRRIGEVQELIEAEQYQEAFDKLLPMLESRRRYNKNEIAQIHRMVAFIYFEQDNIPKTIEHFEQVIAQVPDITEALENITLDQLSKLYFQQGMNTEGDAARALFNKSLRTTADWMSKVDDVGPEPHQFVATVHYQLDDYPSAVESMETAVRLAQEDGDKVKESWWNMLLALHAEADNWDRVVEVAEILVKDYPKRSHWMTLAGAYGETDQENKQLWAIEAAHAGGYLEREADFTIYGGLLLQHGVPNRATKYLEEGFDEEFVERTPRNLKLLGQAFQMAKDYDEAIPVFEEAGNLEEDGETLSRLANLYAMRGKYEKCEKSAQDALDKGGLRRALGTKVTRATCLFDLKRLREARKIFSDVRAEARNNRETASEAKIAGQWIRHIDAESRRLEVLEQMAR